MNGAVTSAVSDPVPPEVLCANDKPVFLCIDPSQGMQCGETGYSRAHCVAGLQLECNGGSGELSVEISGQLKTRGSLPLYLGGFGDR